MQPLMSEQTFIIISCTSTYGVLLSVKFNKKKYFFLDGFEGLQGLWTGGGGGWDFRPDRFFFSVKIRARNKKEKSPPTPPIIFVSSRVTVAV
jgi:hypothetical protein